MTLVDAPHADQQTFWEAFQAVQARVEGTLDAVLPKPAGPERRVLEAMRYAVFGDAKRLRPFLAVESGRLFGVEEAQMLRVAAAVECLHTYSLIHDDLPCMDDDPLRRGRAATHIAFDEAVAVLAGDALLTFSFDLLADPETHDDPSRRVNLVRALAHAAGYAGMVGGQMIDLDAEGAPADVAAVARLQRLKTGALISFACEAGAIMGGAGEEATQALYAYAHDLGLCFQITDDLLDAEGSSEDLGKTAGKDEASGKATFVSLMGLERARNQAQTLARQAVAHLDVFDERATSLRALPDFVLTRRR